MVNSYSSLPQREVYLPSLPPARITASQFVDVLCSLLSFVCRVCWWFSEVRVIEAGCMVHSGKQTTVFRTTK